MAGNSYKVRRDFKSLRDNFRSGEIMKYEGDAYSRYDCVTGYFFSQPKSKNGRVWDVHDSENLGSWKELFEEI